MLTTGSVLMSSLSLLSGALASIPPVRIPPYFNSYAASNTSTPWIAPPPEFYGGTFYMRNVSNASYREKTNLQWDVWLSTPTCVANSTDSCPPSSMPGQMIEITTWTLGNPDHPEYEKLNCGAVAPGDRHVASFLGHHTPRQLSHPEGLAPKWNGVWDIAGTDGYVKGYNEQWAVLAWGYDGRGDAFLMLHEDNSTTNGEQSGLESLNCVTRSETGVDLDTLDEVLEALDNLGDERMSRLVREIGPTEWDEETLGGPAICPEGCLINTPVGSK